MPKGSETKTYLAACVQFDIERGRVADNLAAAEAGVRDAAGQGAQLVVLPELWTTSFVQEASVGLIRESREAERAMTRLSEELGIMVVGGGLEEERGAFFNRALLVDRGRVIGTYRKIHMFTPNAEDKLMTAGTRPLIADTRLGRIAVAICYDIRFPELTRYYFHFGVQVLAVPAQWPEARVEHWRTMVRARALENQMFVLGCNRTGAEESLRNEDTLVFPGESRIADPMGDVIGAAQGDDLPLLAEIELRRCRTMQRILPIHKDRQMKVYQELWRPIWDNPSTSQLPEVPTIQEATKER
ncbi:MAG: carbon-nitrogen family hydrolase [Planctomycetes bacterium]|nr:carbon-nitrogen family hydrolase [Planctomycetota bacterium]